MTERCELGEHHLFPDWPLSARVDLQLPSVFRSLIARSRDRDMLGNGLPGEDGGTLCLWLTKRPVGAFAAVLRADGGSCRRRRTVLMIPKSHLWICAQPVSSLKCLIFTLK